MCTVSSLSPGDEVFQRFLTSVGRLIPDQGEDKTRIRSLSPNEVSVALWIDVQEFSLLLGADLEKRGWVTILEGEAHPAGKASAYKIPHHGSENADLPAVWDRMLENNPVAVLTPWRRGSKALPTTQDVERILKATPHAWITNKGSSGQSNNHENRAVAKTLRESRVHIRRPAGDKSMVRLRRLIDDSAAQWEVERFGDACRLVDYVA